MGWLTVAVSKGDSPSCWRRGGNLYGGISKHSQGDSEAVLQLLLCSASARYFAAALPMVTVVFEPFVQKWWR